VPRVCVVGSANVDYTVALARLPEAGETVTDGTLLVNLGGKGANQAVAARRLGAEVRMIGCVGRDAGGDRLRESLTAEGIDTAGLMVTDAAATGTALILVDRAGANQIGVAPGANRALTVEMVARHEAALGWAEIVLCQLEVPVDVVAWTLECARRRGVRTVLNPAPARALDDALLGLADVLTPNAGEARALSGPWVGAADAAPAAAARAAAERLRARGVGTVIVTLGEHGALAVDAAGATEHPAFRVTAVDTTGAGDAFNGALGVALASGTALAEAIALASATAALACTRRGAQDALPTQAEVQAFIRAAEGGAR
jgi:ribokinase